MRAELFSVSQLQEHARALGRTRLIGASRAEDQLLTRLADNAAALRDAYTLVTAAVTASRRITPAAEWLLDNFYLVEEQVLTSRRHLPRATAASCPAWPAAPRPAYPRVYDIALELISHVDGRIDADSLARLRRRLPGGLVAPAWASCGPSRSCCGWR